MKSTAASNGAEIATPSQSAPATDHVSSVPVEGRSTRVKSSRHLRRIAFFLAPMLAVSLAAQVKSVRRSPSGDRHKRAAFLDPSYINYIRPGVKVKIVSAAIAQDGTI